MEKSNSSKNSTHRLKIIFVSVVVVLAALVGMTSIMAQESVLTDANLSGSIKSADKSEARVEDHINYTVVISNSGDFPSFVWMTDTLPTNTTYVEGSLSVSNNQGAVSINNNVVHWFGSADVNQEVVVSFSASIDGSTPAGSVIINTAEITGTGGLITRTTSTTVVSTTGGLIYLPISRKPLTAATLDPIGRPTPDNRWSLSWRISDDSGVIEYEIEEAHNPDFTNSDVYMVSSPSTTYEAQRPLSTANVYYYRVRAKGANISGPWSNVESIIGGYRDNFTDSNSGWKMRRQDTDHIENKIYYQNGHLILEQDSSWDYQIAGSMALPPKAPYRIETRVQLVGVDNLHAYGIIFGGDWNGQTCPNSSFTSCFNQYYRLISFWSGNADKRMTTQLKRIDTHDPVNNAGRGKALNPWQTVTVNDPANGYQQWAIEVYPDGKIKIFVNGNLVDEVFDTQYITRPYFGAFSATDEYNGLQAEFDWYQVTALP